MYYPWSLFDYDTPYKPFYIFYFSAEEEQRRVQTVGVVLNGRLGSLLAVKEMLIERIPVVVIANSGGVADFIRHGIELLKEHGARDETVTNSDVEHARVQV